MRHHFFLLLQRQAGPGSQAQEVGLYLRPIRVSRPKGPLHRELLLNASRTYIELIVLSHETMSL